MKTGFPLRPNVFGLIFFYALTTVFGLWLIIWLPLLAMEAVGREPAWNLSALVGIPVLFVIIFRPLQLGILAVLAALRGEDALVITEDAVELFGPNILYVPRENIEKVEIRSAPRFPWREQVILHLRHGKRTSILSYYFPGGGPAIMRALEAPVKSGGPWSRAS